MSAASPFLGEHWPLAIWLDRSQLQTFLYSQPVAYTMLAPRAVGHMVMELDIYFQHKGREPQRCPDEKLLLL